MNPLRDLAWSTIGKKIVMAVTGLALILFLVGHLVGNLLLFVGPDAFNAYGHKLVSLGWLLYVVEAGLLAFLVLHMVSGVQVWLEKRRARPEAYQVRGDAGGPSRKTISSRTMLITGIVLLVFLVVHLKTFKFGPVYETEIHGEPGRDLYRLVVESFTHPLYAGFYVICMALMGFHLRHAFWSAFQSLGVHHRRLTPVLVVVGTILAVLLAVGFLFMPVWFFLRGGGS